MSTEKSVCIIGAGPSGLVTASTLIQDGFTNVQIFTRDRSPGGTWCAERVYPDLYINNVNGEYNFSSHPMPPPANDKMTGGRLSGEDLRQYMESFAERFLKDSIRFNTEVVAVRRLDAGRSNWLVTVKNLSDGTCADLPFDCVVLCTGGCSNPKFPDGLSPEDGKAAGFSGLVVHSTQFRARLDDILSAVKPLSDSEPGSVVVVGGGKSAQDIASYFANQGRKVSVIFERTDAFLATPKPLPAFLRKSRFTAVLSPHIELRTALERFLHTTRIGSTVVHAIWNHFQSSGYKTFEIAKDSPIRLAPPVFWTIRANDEGVGRPNNFFRLVNAGKIEVLAPQRAVSFGDDGRSIVLKDGKSIKADALVLASGYQSSWTEIFDQKTREDLGLDRSNSQGDLYSNEWDNYKTLANPPPHKGDPPTRSSTIYRGLVPAKNILRRDFAINGAVFTTDLGYVVETSAHWISSYLRGDRFLRLPKTPEDALAETERTSAWLRKRFPESLHWVNESHGFCVFFNGPQFCDSLLEDMGLRSMRSGGNWLTWPFKVMDTQELANLQHEREIKRAELNQGT